MESNFSVSVVIPTYKRLDMLKKCLHGVSIMSLKPHQIIVSYRPEEDRDTAVWLETDAKNMYNNLDLVKLYEPGQVFALNAAIEHATKDIIVIFDDDVVPHQDWLHKIIVHFEHVSVGGVGGRDIVHPNQSNSTIEKAGFRTFWNKIYGGHHLIVGKHRDVETLKGCNMSFRRSILGSLKFDDRLLGSGAQVANDLWYCLNIRNAGWRIILEPNAIVDHYPAIKEDYNRHDFDEFRCLQTTFNTVAAETAFLTTKQKLLYFFHSILIGSRTCPGGYFIIHSILKRPKSLKGQLAGGWIGFFKGWKEAKKFKLNPPGVPQKINAFTNK